MSLMIDRFLLSRLESLYESFKSSEGGQRRDCVICSVPLSLHSANPTDSPGLASRLVGRCLYSDAGASGGVTVISRIKVVRPPPAAGYALAPCGICGQFPHLPCRRGNRPQTPQAKEDTYARKWMRSADGITRPEATSTAFACASAGGFAPAVALFWLWINIYIKMRKSHILRLPLACSSCDWVMISLGGISEVKSSSPEVVLYQGINSTIPQAPLVVMISWSLLLYSYFTFCNSLSNFAILLITFILDYAEILA